MSFSGGWRAPPVERARGRVLTSLRHGGARLRAGTADPESGCRITGGVSRGRLSGVSGHALVTDVTRKTGGPQLVHAQAAAYAGPRYGTSGRAHRRSQVLRPRPGAEGRQH